MMRKPQVTKDLFTSVWTITSILTHTDKEGTPVLLSLFFFYHWLTQLLFWEAYLHWGRSVVVSVESRCTKEPSAWNALLFIRSGCVWKQLSYCHFYSARVLVILRWNSYCVRFHMSQAGEIFDNWFWLIHLLKTTLLLDLVQNLCFFSQNLNIKHLSVYLLWKIECVTCNNL